MEAVALLAGVSASYYTRLEQGASCHASVEILDAIARALHLDEPERYHLHDLATACRHRGATRRPPAERISPATRDLVRALGEVPVIVTGRRSDVLAWNALGHAVLAGHVDPTSPGRAAERPNMARLVFLDAHIRELYVDWNAKARAVVGNLRLTAGRHPEDAQLTSLIGELTTRSAEFAGMWADHRVRPCDVAEYDLRHPLVGALTVTQQTLSGASTPEQSLVLVTTAPGSASQAALTLLAQATARRSMGDMLVQFSSRSRAAWTASSAEDRSRHPPGSAAGQLRGRANRWGGVACQLLPASRQTRSRRRRRRRRRRRTCDQLIAYAR
jgi:transcriptional regulator with XRE-family HTH domain